MTSYIISIFLLVLIAYSSGLTDREIWKLREEVRGMFYHAYEGYMEHAYPYDELRPLSCDGQDTWGSYSLTLIDALDTLAVMGNKTEFRRVAELVQQRANFDVDINVSVFETNIRIIGGLLSAHLMSRRMGVDIEEGWPCAGPLLRMAKDVADRLLPAFDTSTGMPYGTVNLRDGVPEGETPVTCTAGVGTFVIEFGSISRLTGDPVYEEVAMRAMHALWNHRSSINLLGNHVDVSTGRWTAQDSGIGAGVDSYFEYLVKGASLLQRPELMAIFNEARKAIDKHLRHDDWYLWATMSKGHVTMAVFQSLEAYWPGLLALVGDINSALKIVFNYHQVWKQFGFTPEFYNIPQAEASVNREGYPLRPELVESLMYLYRATKDDTLLEMGADLVASIKHTAKTDCGYATVKNVNDHSLENRMESFFLAETTKYLFLLFDKNNWLHNTGSSGVLQKAGERECVVEAGGYIFNTEAHPIDPGALACCFTKEEDWSFSVADHVALILEPTRPWAQHRGRKAKQEVDTDDAVDCGEKAQSEHDEVDEEAKVFSEEEGVSLAEKKVISSELDSVEKGFVMSSAFSSPELSEGEDSATLIESKDGTIEMDDVDKNQKIDDPGNIKENADDDATQTDQIKFELLDIDVGDKAHADSHLGEIEEIKHQEPSQQKMAIENEDFGPRIVNKDSSPRFSSLSETAEREIDGNTSAMEAASISPSVSSSKYSTNSGSGRIITDAKDAKITLPVKKVFILADLRERLVTDLAAYKNFTSSSSYSLLSCTHPSFITMLNVKGQMFYP